MAGQSSRCRPGSLLSNTRARDGAIRSPYQLCHQAARKPAPPRRHGRYGRQEASASSGMRPVSSVSRYSLEAAPAAAPGAFREPKEKDQWRTRGSQQVNKRGLASGRSWELRRGRASCPCLWSSSPSPRACTGGRSGGRSSSSSRWMPALWRMPLPCSPASSEA